MNKVLIPTATMAMALTTPVFAADITAPNDGVIPQSERRQLRNDPTGSEDQRAGVPWSGQNQSLQRFRAGVRNGGGQQEGQRFIILDQQQYRQQ